MQYFCALKIDKLSSALLSSLSISQLGNPVFGYPPGTTIDNRFPIIARRAGPDAVLGSDLLSVLGSRIGHVTSKLESDFLIEEPVFSVEILSRVRLEP